MNLSAVLAHLQTPNAVVLVAALTLAAAACMRQRERWRRRDSNEHRRGALLSDGRSMQRCAARFRETSSEWVTLAGIAIPRGDETKHFKLIGTTGTGKSTAIRELLGCAIARGDRAVFADPDAGYVEHFYDRYRGDIVLNPFEPQSAKWDLFAEIQESFDVEKLAGGLIPDSEDASAREWRGYARTFLAAILRRCRFSGAAHPGELWRLLTAASADELRPIVAGTPAQPFLDPENARMFGSIRSVTGSAIAAFEYIERQRGRLFSVREWVQARGSPGMLFIPYRAGQIAALRSLIATWMHLAIFEAMSQSPRGDQRLWFVIDELDALGAIAGLKDALARLRKFGCCCVLGFQSIAQVSSTYGHGEAQTIVENCSNTLILRCSGSENGGTSLFASRLIGDREVLRRQESRGRDRESGLAARGGRRSRSTTHNHVTEPAVMASELEQLPDLCGYLKTASSAAWLKVAFTKG
jgi:type IV secretory pathway TraG/TraD family ATPase VirD4